MQLKAIIVEDEKHSRENLKNLLQEFCTGVEVLSMAGSVQEAIDRIKALEPDLIFLDIELRTGTGFDVLQALQHLNFEVIFTTAFEQYAIKAVKFSSLDYLLKPIDIEELQRAVARAKVKKNQTVYRKQLETLMMNLKERQPKLTKICLATSDGFEFVKVEDILFCKADGSYTQFVIHGMDKLLVSKNLKEYESLLLEQGFMRVHNSFLINLKRVKKYVKSDGGYIIMDNGDLVSISRSKKEDFIKIMSSLT